MKGDGNIKTLRFIGAGYNDMYQVKVNIYCCNVKVFEGVTYNGEIQVDLAEGVIYRVEAFFLDERLCSCLYVTRNCIYTFIFTHALYTRTITISLVDLYYNLPIERGEIFLWQSQ